MKGKRELQKAEKDDGSLLFYQEKRGFIFVKRKTRSGFSTTTVILISFFVAILAGAVLLALPISSASGEATPFLDALFTATTSTCVTGLVVVPTVSSWSVFGQVVILLLIQIGGLGVVTIMSAVMILLHKKMGIGDRLLLQDAFNLNSLSGLVRFVKKVLLGTFLIEGVGALLYMIVFVPAFGIKGIWISLFNSVSAFCNAGIDIIGETSLAPYVHSPLVNFVTCALIFLGGIGYIVWWDVVRVASLKGKRKKGFSSLTLHSKIAISTSVLLVFFGAVLIFIFEYHNPDTIGAYSFFDKIQASIFQSVTTRTAGFFTIPQENFTNATSILCLFLMFIGGSPVGTAGGIKTVTFAVICATAISQIRNKEETQLFDRSITREAVSKALAVTFMSFAIMFLSTVMLSAVSTASALDIAYETVSATATVGLTRGITPNLSALGKIIIILTMYLGRVGPISLAVAFGKKKKNQNIVGNPVEEISVG